jgi:hypothetical protein
MYRYVVAVDIQVASVLAWTTPYPVVPYPVATLPYYPTQGPLPVIQPEILTSGGSTVNSGGALHVESS